MSFGLGIALSILNLCVWGSWPYVRTLSSATAATFIPLYLIGQLVAATVVSLAIDARGIAQSLSEGCDPAKAFCITIGGCIVAFADFLCVCSFVKLPYSTAFPIYTGFVMALGSVFDFLVQSYSGTFNKDGSYSDPLATLILFIAVFLALAAIFCLAQSEKPAEKSLLAGGEDDSREGKGSHDADDADEISKSNNKWIAVCLIAGTLAGFWSPLVNFGKIIKEKNN